MMKYAPQSIKEKLKQNNINSLNQLQKQKSSKYKQTLKFMTEWSNDLLERQHDIYQSQQQLNLQLINLQAKSKTYQTQRTQQTTRDNQFKQLNIQRIIQEELIRKIQDVYTKQILLYQTCQPVNKTFNTDEAPSHQQSIQSQSSHQQLSHQSSSNSQNHHRMSSNFSNYFNNYECQTDSKNYQQSQNSQAFSKASELVQQQYASNQVYQEQNEQSNFIHQNEINSEHHRTYEQNFGSF